MKLYHYWRSTSSWRVRWALSLKRIPCEMIAINLLGEDAESDAHIARNPMGYVPVLELAQPDGARARFLAESLAIIQWLEDTYPQAEIMPGDAFQRAQIRMLAEIINAGTQPLINLNVTEHHSQDPEEKKRWNQYWIRRGLTAYEALIKDTAGKFSVGDSLTLADLCLIPQCYSAGRNEVSLAEFPTIARIEAAALATESCQASHPDRFAPALSSA